jgi:hypothetical protein
MTGKELRNLQESYFEMYNPERIDEDIQGMNDAELYKRSINAPTKVEKKNVNKEMKRRETLVSGRKKKPAERKFVGGRWRTVGESYELDEASVTDDRVRRNQRAFGSNYTPPRDWDQSANRGKGAVLNAKQKEKQRRKGLAKSAMGEAVDLYDVVLSHLLDEGYADTQEAAEAIMVNMSEEWIDSIVG